MSLMHGGLILDVLDCTRGHDVITDSMRLNYIERSQSYPWPDFGGVWKFRPAKDRPLYYGTSLRECLNAAIRGEKVPLQDLR